MIWVDDLEVDIEQEAVPSLLLAWQSFHLFLGLHLASSFFSFHPSFAVFVQP